MDHAFSTRLGGCSSGEFATLNTAYHTGDRENNVIENRRRFFHLFNYDYREVVSAAQVHGTALAVVNRENRGEGALSGSARKKCDALVTTEERLPLTAYSADCMLIYFVSKQMPLIALAHAGWRGTLGGIGINVIRFLQSNYGADPQQMLVALSPAICRSCYRVDEETAELFSSAGWSSSAYQEPAAEDGFKLDLTAVNKEQMVINGIKTENLSSTGLCTSCNRDLFYSYRRDRGITGRMLGFIAIRGQSGGSLS